MTLPKRKRILLSQGLCVEGCGRGVVIHHIRCLDCLIKNKLAARRYRAKQGESYLAAMRDIKKKRFDEGRCRACGRPKDLDADAGMVRCISCRTQI